MPYCISGCNINTSTQCSPVLLQTEVVYVMGYITHNHRWTPFIPLSSPPPCIEKHLTPTSIMYFVIITGGKKSTKSPKNANNFKPNQPLIKQRGFFFSNTFELHMNLQLGEVDHMLTLEGVHYSQRHYEECA